MKVQPTNGVVVGSTLCVYYAHATVHWFLLSKRVCDVFIYMILRFDLEGVFYILLLSMFVGCIKSPHMSAYLRDGPAQTIVRAVKLRWKL